MPSPKPKAKIDLIQSVREQAEAYVKPLRDQLTDFLSRWEKARNVVKNNYDLGLHHLVLGNLDDAILRFRLVTWLDPNYAQAWYYLGCAYLAARKNEQAQKAFRASVRLKPDFEEAGYMLAVAAKGQVPIEKLPRRMPLTLAQTHFDGRAAAYAQEQETLKYQGHMLLTNAIRLHLVPGQMNYEMLELGVGTGLCGPLLRDVAVQLIGADISAAMLAEAAKLFAGDGRRAYDALIKREAHEYLQQQPLESVDVIYAANLLRYIGDAHALFALAAPALRPGGLFALTADQAVGDVPEGVRFDALGQHFRFTLDYLRHLAAEQGLREVALEEAEIYPKRNAWLCIFAK